MPHWIEQWLQRGYGVHAPTATDTHKQRHLDFPNYTNMHINMCTSRVKGERGIYTYTRLSQQVVVYYRWRNSTSALVCIIINSKVFYQTETIQNEAERWRQVLQVEWEREKSHWVSLSLSERKMRECCCCFLKCWLRQKRQMKRIKRNSSFCSTKGEIKYFNVWESYWSLLSLDRKTFVDLWTIICLELLMSDGYNFIAISERHNTLQLNGVCPS